MGEKNIELFRQLLFPICIVALMWFVKIIEVENSTKFTEWGIFPRDWDGIIGIFSAPFIHSDWQHLMSNSLPLLILMSIVMVFYKRVAIPSILTITASTGIAVWLFARGDIFHIGASGIIFGLVSFLIWTGIFRQNFKSVFIALLIAVIYRGYVYAMIPTHESVSWESHLFGGIAGMLTAFLFCKRIEEDEVGYAISSEEQGRY